MDAGGRATQGAVAEGQGEGNQYSALLASYPDPLPGGEMSFSDALQESTFDFFLRGPNIMNFCRRGAEDAECK